MARRQLEIIVDQQSLEIIDRTTGEYVMTIRAGKLPLIGSVAEELERFLHRIVTVYVRDLISDIVRER